MVTTIIALTLLFLANKPLGNAGNAVIQLSDVVVQDTDVGS
jgi:hypothetical protein